MSNYFKYLAIVGIPVSIFLALFFSLLLGIKEGFVPGLLIGLVVGGLLAFVPTFFYSGAAKNLMSDWSSTLRGRPSRPINLLQVVLPLFVLLSGAVIARFYGHATMALPLTVTLSLSIYVACSIFAGDLTKAIEDREMVAYIAGVIALIIRFILTYFILMFILTGFDLDRMRSLF